MTPNVLTSDAFNSTWGKLKNPNETAREIKETYGTPTYVYFESALNEVADYLTSAPHAYGLQVSFAMKALPTTSIIKLLYAKGIHIDASSGYEVMRALKAGVSASDIMLTSQELPDNDTLAGLLKSGVKINACSLNQIKIIGQIAPNSNISIRVNPGLGSGAVNRVNTGGPASSFGIWHEQIETAKLIAAESGLTINCLHSHIGNGTDPVVWTKCANLTLDVAKILPDVKFLNLGGGFKLARVAEEKAADVHKILGEIKNSLEDFAKSDGRKLKLMIEPGTYMVGNCGYILSEIKDIVDTGENGYTFIKLDSGMTELLRPSLYGAQHPIITLNNSAPQKKDYVVVGHCCESGDIFTPGAGDPEGIKPRLLGEQKIGNLILIGGAGAYASGMPAKNYNSFPEAPEVLIKEDGSLSLIRRRQTLEQVLENEI